MDSARISPDPHPSPIAVDLGALQGLLESHPAMALCLDLEGRVRWINPDGAARLGLSRGDIEGRPFVGHLISHDELQRHAAVLSQQIGEQIAADVQLLGERLRRGLPADPEPWSLRHRDGSLLPTTLRLAPLRDQQGRMAGFIALQPALDNGSINPSETNPPRLAHHDGLTGLPNRAVLTDRAEMAMQRASRQSSMVAVMLIEIEGFDALCEEHGFSVGDDLLRATASRLHFELRKTDTAVRLDGGQFVALLVDLHHLDEARMIAEKMQKALSSRVNVGVAIVPLVIRIGVAGFPEHGDQLLPLLESAENALDQLPVGVGGVAWVGTPVATA